MQILETFQILRFQVFKKAAAGKLDRSFQTVLMCPYNNITLACSLVKRK